MKEHSPTFTRRYVSPVYLALFLVSLIPAAAQASAISYVQSIWDQFQSVVYVCKRADCAANHFVARGEFDNLRANLVPAMHEISRNATRVDITCITATFDPLVAQWGGWYFMNGVLWPADRNRLRTGARGPPWAFL